MKESAEIPPHQKGETMTIEIHDMPKLKSPFARKTNEKGEFVITNEIAKGYEWVFEGNDVICTEKLNGTNVSILIEDGQIKQIWNRSESVPFFNKEKQYISLGLLESFRRGYMEFLSDGQHFGELIGEKLQGNPYKIDGHLWVPFETYAQNHLAYKSWNSGKYQKDFQTISNWFENDLFSLFMARTQSSKGNMCKVFPEGVVFVKPSTGQMAKLRSRHLPLVFWGKT